MRRALFSISMPADELGEVINMTPGELDAKASKLEARAKRLRDLASVRRAASLAEVLERADELPRESA